MGTHCGVIVTIENNEGLSPGEAALKRGFDLVVTIAVLGVGWYLIALAWLMASLDTRSNGFFLQERIGRNGEPFKVIKLKTMRAAPGVTGKARDLRITRVGAVLRNLKVDELPQLLNVLLGHMSLVGPRPDLSGFADRLQGADRLILSIRPGITGPATLKYRNEEALLAQQSDPESYRRDVIWPDKVRINLDYIRNWRFTADLRYLWRTLAG